MNNYNYDSFMLYMEYLYANGLTLDKNGNEVPINDEEEYKLILTKDDEDEEE